MPNALIYSPDFDGHRQVYVYVLTQILKELGFIPFIAGNWDDKITDSTYIEKLKHDRSITKIDTSNYAQSGLKIANKEFIEIQNKFKIDLTIFTEADFHINLFNARILNKKNKIRGRTVGIFLRPFYFYHKLSFLNKLRYLKHLPSTWRFEERLFHGYLLKRFKLLDYPLYIDENFVLHHPYYHWLPDVFQRYVETLVANESSDQSFWIDRLNEFKEKNEGRFVFLYFGTAQKRRGYDLLLKMAVDQDACFIHCGLNNEDEKSDINVIGLKQILHENGRLLETRQFISDPECIEHFFKSASHLVLPYRNFLGSSGIMLQALDYGIPVLVPDKGVMGYRVKKYNLGLTYNGHPASLEEQFQQFKKLPREIYKNSIEEYMKYQTPGQLKKVLVNAFTGSGQIVTPPGDRKS